MISFSAIIPLYNKENSVQRAVRSVLGQTYPNFELIIVDDGSTDESLSRASSFQDGRIRIVHQENAGVSAARNRGVEESQYDWVAFLDADDEWMPEFLSMMVELHNSFDACGLLGASFIHYRESGLDDSHQRQSRYPYGWKGVLANIYEDLLHPPFCSSSVAIQKKVFRMSGGYPQYLCKGEDTYLYIQLDQLTRFAFNNMVGGIYHLEAENRSDPTPTLLDSDPRKPYSHALTIHKLFQEQKIPPEKRKAAIEFMAASDLPISRRLIDLGYKQEARERLWTYRSTTKYRNKWIRTFLRSFLPLKSAV